MIFQVTAKRLTESKQTIPHYYLTIDVEMDKVMQLRKNFNAELQNQGKSNTPISVGCS